MKSSIHPFPKMCKALNSSEIGCSPMGCLLTSTNVELLERTTNPYLACVLAACLLRVLYVCTIYFPIIKFKGFLIIEEATSFTLGGPWNHLLAYVIYEVSHYTNMTMFSTSPCHTGR